MPVTIESLQADLERQRRDLLRARKEAQEAASDIADQATRAGRDAFTKDEDARFEAHLKTSRDAADKIDVIDGKLAEVRQVGRRDCGERGRREGHETDRRTEIKSARGFGRQRSALGSYA